MQHKTPLLDTTIEKLSWLRSMQSTNVGPKTFVELLKIYGTAEEVLHYIPELARSGGNNRGIVIPSMADVKRELQKCHDFGAEIILSYEEEYPSLLQEIDDYPPLLVIKGRKELLKKEKIAIVGSRNASINGVNLAKHFAEELSRYGYIIISGMAKGIDAAAHTASLEMGTIGVIAGGIDQIYPKENQQLFEKVYNQGLIISEYMVGRNILVQYREKILNAIPFTEIKIDDLVSYTAIDYSIINFLILELELAGRVLRTPGNKVCRISTR